MKIQHEFTVIEETLTPGNMTQYDLTVAIRPDRSLMVCLYDDPTRHTGRVMTFVRDPDKEYAAKYVAEKLQCGLGDVGVLLAYLKNNYEINIYLDNRYNPSTGVWIGHVVQ